MVEARGAGRCRAKPTTRMRPSKATHLVDQPEGAADRVVDDVRAAPPAVGFTAVDEVLLLAVDDDVQPSSGRPRLLRPADYADDLRARRLAELHGGAADAAGRAWTRRVSPGPSGPAVEAEPAGLVADVQGGCFGVVELVGRVEVAGPRPRTTSSANPPWGRTEVPITRSPTANSDTPAPSSTISPHSSRPGVKGSSGRTWYSPRHMRTSGKLAAQPSTLTSSSRIPRSGSSSSSSRKTFRGSPDFVELQALVVLGRQLVGHHGVLSLCAGHVTRRRSRSGRHRPRAAVR